MAALERRTGRDCAPVRWVIVEICCDDPNREQLEAEAEARAKADGARLAVIHLASGELKEGYSGECKAAG